jgi:methyl-accepting chemotaxis protein
MPRREQSGSAVRWSRSLITRAALLLVGVMGAVAALTGTLSAAALSRTLRHDLDLRGSSKVRILERHQDLHLAVSLGDRDTAQRVLEDVLAADEDVAYVAAVRAGGDVLAAASRTGDPVAVATAALPLHALAGGAPASSDALRRFTQPVLDAGAADAGLELPGADAPRRVSGHLILALDATRLRGEVSRHTFMTVAVSGLALLAAFSLFFLVLVRRARRMMAFAEALAAGDLGATLDPGARDELGRVAEAMLRVRESTAEVVKQLRVASGDLQGAAGEVLASADAQVDAAQTQAGEVERSGTEVERVRGALRQAGAQAGAVIERAHESAASAERGAEAVGEALQAIVSLRDQGEAMAGTVAALVDRAAEIGTIAAAIHDLASQSAVLAVNAAIEAARAGDAGRGFGTIAGEISRLADRSRTATAQVQRIVGEVQRAARASVAGIEESRDRARRASDLAHASGDAIVRLAQAIEASSASAEEIARAAQEQVPAVDALWETLQGTSRGTRAAAATAAQLREASRAISAHAERMRELVRIYREGT